MKSSIKSLLIGAAISVAVASAPAQAADISGAGATFPYPIYAKWADSYKKETGNGLNYQSIGSGGGIKQITARTVTFGATDKPLTDKERTAGGDLMQWPMVMGGIVPVVNLEGIKANELVLDGTTLAKIFLGEIKTWDDAAIKKLNPSCQAAVRRDRGRSPLRRIGHDLQLHGLPLQGQPGLEIEGWFGDFGRMAGGIGAKGNEGVANNVQQAKNSIGYVETAYAKQNKLTTTKMVNKDGKTVEANRRNGSGRCRKRGLGACGRLLSHHHRSGRRELLADLGFDLHPDAEERSGCRGCRRSAQVLLLGLCEWRRGCVGARLRSDARGCEKACRVRAGVRLKMPTARQFTPRSKSKPGVGSVKCLSCPIGSV